MSAREADGHPLYHPRLALRVCLGEKGPAVPTRPPLQRDDPTVSLALTVVCSSPTPLLLLGPEYRVIAASASFCTAFNIEPTRAVGEPLFALGLGEWDSPQLRTLMIATASGDAEIDSYEFDLERAGQGARRLIVQARKLVYGDGQGARLLVAVHDATEERAQAQRGLDLARDNAILIQETRHRIANSPQIIASVMLMNARRSSSDETRGYLRDAHNRVMSIAELQRQLAVSATGAVHIGDYLTRLCQTISASMVANPDLLSIRVEASDALVDAEMSVSLGLIVTELVINALKHGFPKDAGGRIDVGYSEVAADWTLSVRDDGIGMGNAPTTARGGLGTSIVEALAKRLGARVVVAALSQGVKVSIVHRHAPATAVGHPAPGQAPRPL